MPPAITVSPKNSIGFELFGQAITAPRIEFIVYTDLDDPTKLKTEFYTTAQTTVTMQLLAGDPWIVHGEQSVLDEPLALSS